MSDKRHNKPALKKEEEKSEKETEAVALLPPPSLPPAETEKPVPKKHRGAVLFMHLSFKVFLMSQVVILLAGLTFLGGLYYILNKDSFKQKALTLQGPVTNEPLSFSLDIRDPDDEVVVFSPEITINGNTSPKAVVMISNTTEQPTADGDIDQGVEAGGKGEFSLPVSLMEGLNFINISAFDQFGNTKNETRTIYYSKEKLPE